MPDSCIFCGNEQELTDEHILPKWLRRRYFGTTRRAHRKGSNGTLTTWADRWIAPATTHKIRTVCRLCNNHWMSDIETAASPILLPMIRGREVTLDEREQRIVATWSFKTMVVFDDSYDNRMVSPADITYLYEHKEPPPSVTIWLATYGLRTRLATHLSFRFPVRAPDERASQETLYGYGVTLSVGHYVAQAFGDPFSADHRPIDALRKTRDFVARIWPTDPPGASWPTRYSVDDEGLSTLSYPFGGGPEM